jgi:hypothetical protein
LRKRQVQPEALGEEAGAAEPAVEVVEAADGVEVIELSELSAELPPVPPGTLVEAEPKSPLDEILGAFARAMRRKGPA